MYCCTHTHMRYHTSHLGSECIYEQSINHISLENRKDRSRCKFTHCARCIVANTKPHISCTGVIGRWGLLCTCNRIWLTSMWTASLHLQSSHAVKYSWSFLGITKSMLMPFIYGHKKCITIVSSEICPLPGERVKSWYVTDTAHTSLICFTKTNLRYCGLSGEILQSRLHFNAATVVSVHRKFLACYSLVVTYQMKHCMIILNCNYEACESLIIPTSYS